MSKNVIVSERKHTRLSFTPLSVSCSLVCVTPQSTCSQASNSLNGEYEPNREGAAGTPCVVWPQTVAKDRDGIFPDGVVNERFDIDSMEWKANGKPISSLSSWTGKYAIITDASENRGSLIIKKNNAPSDVEVLSFSAKFEDYRTGTVMVVGSLNELVLKTTDKGDDKMSCSVDKPSSNYDPLEDKLLLYEYLVGRGILADGARANYINGKCYERIVNVALAVGNTAQSALPSGVTMRLVKKGTTTAITANSEANPEVMSIVFPNVKFDCRMMELNEYEIQFLKSGKVLCKSYVSFKRDMQKVNSVFPNKGADVVPGQIMYFNDATIMLNDNVVEYPELYYFIQWYTQARVYDESTKIYKWNSSVKRQVGQQMQCDMKKLEIGTTKNDSYFSAYLEVTEDDACQLVADEDGCVLMDESSNLLID